MTLPGERTHAARDGVHPRERSSRDWTVPLLAGLLVVVVVGPFVQNLNVQSGSRMALTAAVTEDGTVGIDEYSDITRSIDRIERDGALYSDKAPLQPLLAVPFYGVARLAGAESMSEARVTENLTAWWVTFWFATVPSAAIVVLMYMVTRRLAPGGALAASLTLFAGTMMLVISTELYGHALAVALVFGAWALVTRVRVPHRTTLVLSGLLAGAGVAVDYPMMLITALIGGYLLIVSRVGWSIGWFVLGGVPATLLLAWYHTLAFGTPLTTTYTVKQTTQGVPTVEWPDVSTFGQVMVGERGLVWLPLILVGLAAAVLLVRSPDATLSVHAGMALAVGAVFVLLQSSWSNPWGGPLPFPRYVYPLLPFLAVPLGTMWPRWRTLILATAAIGALRMSVPLVASLFLPDGASYSYYRDKLLEQGTTPTLFTMGLGTIGWVVHVVLVATVLITLFTAHRAMATALDDEDTAGVARS